MISYTEYYRRRLDDQSVRLKELDKLIHKINCITGKKRNYEEAIGYNDDNDNRVVEENESIKVNNMSNGTN
jgi:hypothetical protein